MPGDTLGTGKIKMRKLCPSPGVLVLGGLNEQCILIHGDACYGRSKGAADSAPENGLGGGWYLERNHFKMDFEGWRPRQERKMSSKRDGIGNGILRKQ